MHGIFHSNYPGAKNLTAAIGNDAKSEKTPMRLVRHGEHASSKKYQCTSSTVVDRRRGLIGLKRSAGRAGRTWY